MSSSVEIIGAEVTRLVSTLPDIDPTKDTDRYHKLLDCCHSLMSLGWQIDEHNRVAEERKLCACNCEHVPVEHPVDSVAPFPEPSTEEYTAPVMETTAEPEPAADTGKTYTMAEVRAALANSRKNGVNVTELLKELGYGNFTAVPAAEYGAVMARLESL